MPKGPSGHRWEQAELGTKNDNYFTGEKAQLSKKKQKEVFSGSSLLSHSSESKQVTKQADSSGHFLMGPKASGGRTFWAV